MLNGDAPLECYTRVKDALQARAKLNKPWRLHFARHTVRSLLSECGVRPDIAELCVGHKKKGMIERYDHYPFFPEMREAMEKLSGLLQQIVSG